MKQHFFLLFLFLFLTINSFAQSAEDYAVELSATVQQSPAQVQLHWKKLNTNPVYTIYRKYKADTTWGAPVATLTSTDSTFTDAAVAAGTTYEYQVLAAGSIPSSGYIFAGINASPMHNRGTLLLLVDSLFTDSCRDALYGLMKDINGDGWQVMRHDIARTTSDTTIHHIIAADYQANGNVKALLLLGHLAVPYAGDTHADGHGDHKGAWPADVYYANIYGPWTDTLVRDTSSPFAATRNVPGDGKWDQSVNPSVSQLQAGRIDFYNMPSFAKTEVQLMNSYLAKDHLYKMDSLNMVRRALIDDHFGAFNGEAFAANGWRNFAPLVGSGDISTIPFIAALKDSAYQWAYGGGGGSFTGAAGIGSTADFDTAQVHAIFTMLFGSYFGDWNTQDNFLRAPLCAPVPALTCSWAGRPTWFFHHMALGETIGYATMLTQNNTMYVPSIYCTRYVHTALMGDPSLRTSYVKPPQAMAINTAVAGMAQISWQPSPDAGVAGYYVYRSDSAFGWYTLLNTTPVAATYTDTPGSSGLKYYMVRPVKLEQTPSGSYYNLGIGITDTAVVLPRPGTGVAGSARPLTMRLYPNPATDRLNVSISAAHTSKASAKITSMDGRILMSCKVQLMTGENTVGFDVQKLAPASYTITIYAGADWESRQWVKVE